MYMTRNPVGFFHWNSFYVEEIKPDFTRIKQKDFKEIIRFFLQQKCFFCISPPCIPQTLDFYLLNLPATVLD